MTTTLSRKNEILYAVAWVQDEPEVYESFDEPTYDGSPNPFFIEEPEGWREYAIERWGVTPPDGEQWPNGYKPFFWPSTKRLYTTRKAAEGRRNLINHWGGNAVVVVAEIDWVPLEEMDAKWKRERLLKDRQKIDAELAELEHGPCARPGLAEAPLDLLTRG